MNTPEVKEINMTMRLHAAYEEIRIAEYIYTKDISNMISCADCGCGCLSRLY